MAYDIEQFTAQSGRIIKENNAVINKADKIETMLGQKGIVMLTDTTELTGVYTVIQCLEDTVFATLTDQSTTNGKTTASVGSDYGTVSAGTPLYGIFTKIKLTSGRVRVYE